MDDPEKKEQNIAMSELNPKQLLKGAVPADTKEITHSGTGRFTRLTMGRMSLYESGDSTGEVSLKDLFDGKKGQVRMVRRMNGIRSRVDEIIMKEMIYA